MKSDLLL